jgi:D-serine deaminase-like pyridoxal phosphate-dependent protein
MNHQSTPRLIESENIPSPALVFFIDRIHRNIEKAISMAGNTSRLRPHVKTHKCPQVVRMKIDSGITKFKCATLAEVKMLAQSGAEDILLAYQPVGPNIKMLFALIETYKSNSVISCVIDNSRTLAELSDVSSRWNLRVPVFIDFDTGMNRTGVQSVEFAVDLARQIQKTEGTEFKGIHVYDGHNTDPDPARRKEQSAEGAKVVTQITGFLSGERLEPGEIVVGGTPMFVQYTDYPNFTLSPGTLFLHDYTSAKYPDLPFEFAAMVLSRVVSIPQKGIFTIDAGAKSISTDYPDKAKLISRPDAIPSKVSEEHWRHTCNEGEEPELGDVLFLLPGHVCTTVHHFDKAYVVTDDGKLVDTWGITARGRI